MLNDSKRLAARAITVDYIAILNQSFSAIPGQTVPELLRDLPGLREQLAAHENVMSAFVRLAARVIREAPADRAPELANALASFLPAERTEMFRPILLAADVRSGLLPSDLPAEPEEVRRVVREVLRMREPL